MNAYLEILDYLEEGEVVEAITLGEDLTRLFPYSNSETMNRGYVKGKVYSFEQAKEFMLDWEIAGGYGGEEVIYFYAWTNKRVLFIGCYDGATWLTSVPRNPTQCFPHSVGGG